MGLVSLEGVGELGDLSWDLKSSHQDSLLSLEFDVLRPLDESGKVGLVEHISSDTVVLGSLLK